MQPSFCFRQLSVVARRVSPTAERHSHLFKLCKCILGLQIQHGHNYSVKKLAPYELPFRSWMMGSLGPFNEIQDIGNQEKWK